MTGELVLTSENTRAINTLSQLDERNRMARAAIKRYADRHAQMDIAIGAAGVFGLAVPALIAAIAAQAPVIYQPLARELAQIYNYPVDDEAKRIVTKNLVFTGAADIAGDFSAAFIMSIASELIVEAGFGAVAGFIPIVGGLVGAALDYVIATAMTWRVGTMVAIYYQNGGTWVGSQKRTLELAKAMTGGVKCGLKDLVSRFTGQNRRAMDLNLNAIPNCIPDVFQSQVSNLRPVVVTMLKTASRQWVRSELQQLGIPISVIDAVLSVAVGAKA